MERCATCKWWEPEAKTTAVRPRADWGRCSLSMSSDAIPDRQEALFVAQDYESYSAYLETHQTFGCVQHEPRGDV